MQLQYNITFTKKSQHFFLITYKFACFYFKIKGPRGRVQANSKTLLQQGEGSLRIFVLPTSADKSRGRSAFPYPEVRTHFIRCWFLFAIHHKLSRTLFIFRFSAFQPVFPVFSSLTHHRRRRRFLRFLRFLHIRLTPPSVYPQRYRRPCQIHRRLQWSRIPLPRPRPQLSV